MKKLCVFFTLLMMFMPIMAGVPVGTEGDDKLDLMGDLADEPRTKSNFDAIEIYKIASTIKIDFYTESQMKVEVFNEAGNLMYTRTVVNYGGETLNIDCSTWNAGRYKIVFANITHNKTAYCNFNL